MAVITETWLNPRVPDSDGAVGSHLIHRTNSDIMSKYSSPDLELLAVKCRSSCLPQEFSSVVIPVANAKLGPPASAPLTNSRTLPLKVSSGGLKTSCPTEHRQLD